MLLIDQLLEFALTGNRVIQVQTAKLILPRYARQWQVFGKPFVQRAVGRKLQGAHGVGDAFNRVLLTVGKIVGWIDIPRIAGGGGPSF